MKDEKIVNLTKLDLPPHLITAIDAFDDAMVKAINNVIESGVHRAMIAGMLHAYAHEQTSRLCENGYA